MQTQASRLLDHLETFEHDDPVATVLCLVRRIQGKSWGKFAANHMRKDREYTCFEMRDGSIVAVNCNLKVVVDPAGSVWPWLLCAPDRSTWEALIRSPAAPDFWPDALRLRIDTKAAA